MLNQSSDKYQCPNCGECLDYKYVLKGSYSPREVIKRFKCSKCNNSVFPHYSDRIKIKNKNNIKLTIISFYFALFLFLYEQINLYNLVLFNTLWLISVIVFGVFLIRQLMLLYSIFIIKKWDAAYQQAINDERCRKLREEKNKEREKIYKERERIFKSIETRGLYLNPLIDKSMIIGDFENFDKTIIENYLNTRIRENIKANIEYLMEYSVSNFKNELWNNNDVDLSVFDKETLALYKELPISIKYLQETYHPVYMSKYSKSDIKEEIQDELAVINDFYSIQVEEAENLLQIGVDNFVEYDFQRDLTGLMNLVYYPSCQVNLDLENFEDRCKHKEKNAVEILLSRVLKNSIYPNYVKKEFEMDYNPENGILILNYDLPNIEQIPNTAEISYVASKNIFKEVFFRDKDLRELYDNILYQIALRTNYEIFKSDKMSFINTIVFNGWITYTDKSDGLEKTVCVMSMQANKNEFLNINLSAVEPKLCFKKFKGIGSSTLYNIIPIKPILNLNKEDKRFVESYGVMEQVSECDNLASMDWKDFENLIREIFEKEFSQNGGEVKVTQSSRDGGVDAIAFDPDPIRGGKIVIQAKRYTNIVGVSAVRDLYGTTLNEGAIKGILVTTSDYGSDSYEFAKDKPITLLNGANLLHLLESHGHKARIDIKEAKENIK